MFKTLKPALLASVALVTPYMPWKVVKTKADDGTEIEVIATKDGNPVWLDSNGSESVMAGDTVSRLNKEAKDNRERAEAAEGKLKPFEGLDPAKARDALALADKIDKKQLLDAGKVDELTAQITNQFTEKLTAAEKRTQELTGTLNQRTLEAQFGKSEFVKDKLALPMDVAQTYFSRNIKFDDNGNMAFEYSDGNPIMSKEKIGEKAGFDEAMSLLVESNPNRDALLKGGNHQGSGNNGGGGGGKPGVKTYRRSEVDKMAVDNPQAMSAAMAEVNAGTAQLVE